ncbi:hypothetical protein PIIN_06640 [Serendipita indica DSM 11827]|uniref:Uncharacterized protein n=1 Tax=Serendipita indica (strain DSM 11827) TaxID=1109443 RepID=G4TN10_SERID|nr:hypothetical protein PIIN_06640 [Serendipita indica DSM 11827]
MSSKTPNSQHEAPNLPEPSSTAGPSSRKRARVYHTASTGLDILGNVSEASDILSPLKAACRATKSILDVVQAVDDNQEEWNDLTQRLEGYMSAIDDQIDAFEKYSPAERAVDDALSQSLAHYVNKIKLDAGDIRKFHRDIEDQHRQLMEKLGLFAALRLQVIEQNTKVILTEGR